MLRFRLWILGDEIGSVDFRRWTFKVYKKGKEATTWDGYTWFSVVVGEAKMKERRCDKKVWKISQSIGT